MLRQQCGLVLQLWEALCFARKQLRREGQGILLNTCVVLVPEPSCQHQQAYISSTGKYQVGDLRRSSAATNISETQRKRLSFLFPAFLLRKARPHAWKGKKGKEADWATGMEEVHGCGLLSECAPKAQRLGDGAMMCETLSKWACSERGCWEPASSLPPVSAFWPSWGEQPLQVSR